MKRGAEFLSSVSKASEWISDRTQLLNPPSLANLMRSESGRSNIVTAGVAGIGSLAVAGGAGMFVAGESGNPILMATGVIIAISGVAIIGVASERI